MRMTRRASGGSCGLTSRARKGSRSLPRTAGFVLRGSLARSAVRFGLGVRLRQLGPDSSKKHRDVFEDRRVVAFGAVANVAVR